MPRPRTELNYHDPFQLLVAVILSAQCTDKRVNMITPALFEAYPDAKAMATATVDDIYELIKSCSYPNNKAKALKRTSESLCERFNCEVPDNMDDLLSLPGVGRKTANVILSVVFDKPNMAVDTHVFRVAERLGLTHKSKTPLKTEQKLVDNIDDEIIPKAHHWLILHGRYTCTARNPQCDKCPLNDLCKSYAEGRSPQQLKVAEDAKKAREKAKEKARADALKARKKAKEQVRRQKEKEKARLKALREKQKALEKAAASRQKAKETALRPEEKAATSKQK